MKKRILATLLALVMALLLLPAAAFAAEAEKPLPDWYFLFAIFKNVDADVKDVKGVTLDPNSPCTRADVVTYLWKLTGSPSAGNANFSDVSANASYAQAVAWAVSKGVTNGTSAATFSPNDTCTRGQIVTFLYRALG